jgi:hypothetical protein
MFRSAQAALCRITRHRLIPSVLFLLTLAWPGPGSAQIVVQYGFEDGTAQGWVAFNGASTPLNSTAAARTGTQSLLTTTNSAGTGGPGIRLTNLVPTLVVPGAPATTPSERIKYPCPTPPGCRSAAPTR